LQIQVNDEPHKLPDGLSLRELIAQLHFAPERIAIELNQKVVRRADWPITLLKENDRVEIVHFVGGGASDGRKQQADGRKRMKDEGLKRMDESLESKL
jgi:sulfur carrier protein